MTATATDDRRIPALVDLIGRTGATDISFGYVTPDQSEMPVVVWLAVSTHAGRHTATAGLSPLQALWRLAETVVDGGECQHCHRPTGVTLDPDPMPLEAVVCWYQYDPELAVMRRGCE